MLKKDSTWILIFVTNYNCAKGQGDKLKLKFLFPF